MGFEDEGADSGAELTSLKSTQKPLFTELQGEPWKAIDLLAEKKKEQWGFEPVQFAVKGAEPVTTEGESKLDFQSPKRVTGSSMARSAVNEPVDESLQMTSLKSTKPDGVAFKKDVTAFPNISSVGGSDHIFVQKQLGAEGIVVDKKLGTERVATGFAVPQENVLVNKKLMATEIEPVTIRTTESRFNPPAGRGFGPINSMDAQFGIPANTAQGHNPFAANKAESKFAIPAAQGELTSSKAFDKFSSAVAERTNIQMGQPAEQWAAAEKMQAIKKADGSFALKPDQNFEPTSLIQQPAANLAVNREFSQPNKVQGIVAENGGGNVVVDKFAQPVSGGFGNSAIDKRPLIGSERFGPVPVEKGSAASIERFSAFPLEKGVSVPVQKSIAPALESLGTPANGKQAFVPPPERVIAPINSQVKDGTHSIASSLDQAETFAFKKQLMQTQVPTDSQIGGSAVRAKFMPAEANVGGNGPIQRQLLASGTERVAQGNNFRVIENSDRSSLRTTGTTAAATPNQQLKQRQDVLTTGSGNGNGALLNSANAARLSGRENEPSAAAAKKLLAVEINLQAQLSSQPLLGKKLVAETTPISELPTKFNKNIPPLTQVERFNPDSQLRAQADRIASGAQMKAQADQSAIKLKGEVASTNFRVPDQAVASKGGNKTQLDAALQPRVAPIKTSAQPVFENGLQTNVGPVKTSAQPVFENGLQAKVGPVKTGTQPVFENGLQTNVATVKHGQQIPAESGLQSQITQIKHSQQTPIDTAVAQPRISPLTGKTQQDLVASLRPQDKVAAANNQGSDLTVAADRKNAASIVKTGADALTTPYPIERGTRMGTAHVVSGDVKLFTGKLTSNTNGAETTGAERRAATHTQIAALLNNVKDGKGDISRTPSFERLMSGAVKSTQDRYVGGEFLLASMIIAAGAARRMPEQRQDQKQDQNPHQKQEQRPEQKAIANSQGHATADITQAKRGDKNASTTFTGQEIIANSNSAIKASAFQQMVDNISKAFTTGRSNEQVQQIEAARRANANQGQSDSVRYITGVELAILLAAGGVTRLRSDKQEAQTASPAQAKDDAAARSIKVASSNGINFNNGRQPINAGADTHISTQIVANMSGQRTELPVTFIQPIQQVQPGQSGPTNRPVDVPAATAKDGKQILQPTPDLITRGERCIPGADVAIAAMLMLGGVTRKRTEERFPANPNELAEKVDRPFRLDRRLGEIVAQAKSFVVREPMPNSGMRATAANIVASGDVQVPPQYKQGAQEPKADVANTRNGEHQFAGGRIYDNNVKGSKNHKEIAEAIAAPSGWVHETVLNKETAEDTAEEKLKKVEKVEKVQQAGAGSGSSAILYRPIWIIAPGETFVSIAEDQFGDGALAWLIADLNTGKFTDSVIEGKRVIEIQSRSRIELPVASDIEEFRHNRRRHQDAENIITIVTASALDMELKQATFKQFLGTLQQQSPIPAILPQIDLVPSPRPARIAPFGMSAPQFASIAAAVSLPLIVPQMDMVPQSADTTAAQVQEIRTEAAKPEDSV